MSWSQTSWSSWTRCCMAWCCLPHSCTRCSTRSFRSLVWSSTTWSVASFSTTRCFIPACPPTRCITTLRSSWCFIPATGWWCTSLHKIKSLLKTVTIYFIPRSSKHGTVRVYNYLTIPHFGPKYHPSFLLQVHPLLLADPNDVVFFLQIRT